MHWVSVSVSITCYTHCKSSKRNGCHQFYRYLSSRGNMSTNVHSHASRQTNANICLYITFSAATIAVVCRLIARRLTRQRLAFDDYLTIVAYIFAAAWMGIVICCELVIYSNVKICC